MAETRLTHERSDPPGTCFVCAPGNEHGLHLEVFHDDDRQVVMTEFTLGETFSGTPGSVHGGITLAVLDEVQSWAVVALAGKDARALRSRIEFREPVEVGRTYRAEAEVVASTDGRVETFGRILAVDGEVRVEGVTTYDVHELDADPG